MAGIYLLSMLFRYPVPVRIFPWSIKTAVCITEKFNCAGWMIPLIAPGSVAMILHPSTHRSLLKPRANYQDEVAKTAK